LRMPDRSTAETSNSLIGILHFLHEVFDKLLCMSQTPDDPADMPILGKVFCTSSSEEGNLIATEFVNFLG